VQALQRLQYESVKKSKRGLYYQFTLVTSRKGKKKKSIQERKFTIYSRYTSGE